MKDKSCLFTGGLLWFILCECNEQRKNEVFELNAAYTWTAPEADWEEERGW